MKVVSSSYRRGEEAPITITLSVPQEVMVTAALSMGEAETCIMELIEKLAYEDPKTWKGLAIDYKRNFEFKRAEERRERRANTIHYE